MKNEIRNAYKLLRMVIGRREILVLSVISVIFTLFNFFSSFSSLSYESFYFWIHIRGITRPLGVNIHPLTETVILVLSIAIPLYKKRSERCVIFPQTNKSQFISLTLIEYFIALYILITASFSYIVNYFAVYIMSLTNPDIQVVSAFDIKAFALGLVLAAIYITIFTSIANLIAAIGRMLGTCIMATLLFLLGLSVYFMAATNSGLDFIYIIANSVFIKNNIPLTVISSLLFSFILTLAAFHINKTAFTLQKKKKNPRKLTFTINFAVSLIFIISFSFLNFIYFADNLRLNGNSQLAPVFQELRSSYTVKLSEEEKTYWLTAKYKIDENINSPIFRNNVDITLKQPSFFDAHGEENVGVEDRNEYLLTKCNEIKIDFLFEYSELYSEAFMSYKPEFEIEAIITERENEPSVEDCLILIKPSVKNTQRIFLNRGFDLLFHFGKGTVINYKDEIESGLLNISCTIEAKSE